MKDPWKLVPLGHPSAASGSFVPVGQVPVLEESDVVAPGWRGMRGQ